MVQIVGFHQIFGILILFFYFFINIKVPPIKLQPVMKNISIWTHKILATLFFITEWNKLSTDCVNASSVNIKKKKYKYLKSAGYIDE